MFVCVWGGYLHSQQHPLPTFVCGRKGAAMSQKREVTHVLSFQTSQQLFFLISSLTQKFITMEPG